jgi:predicted nucleic acid-binding protein
MIHVFLDASVLFAASYSSTGASRELIGLAFQDQVQLVISPDVLDEAERNLTAKLPKALVVFRQVMELLPIENLSPTKEKVQDAASYIEYTDAPIVAATKRARMGELSHDLDRRHLVSVPEVAQSSSLQIILPQELLAAIRQ